MDKFSPNNLFSQLAPEMRNIISGQQMLISDALSAPFSWEDVDMLLKTRQAIVVFFKSRPDPKFGYIESSNIAYWTTSYDASSPDKIVVVNNAISRERIFRGIVDNYAPSRFLDIIKDKAGKHKFDKLLDIKSMFLIFKKRADELGLSSPSVIGRETVLTFLEDVVVYYETIRVKGLAFLRQYLVSVVVNMELIDAKEVSYGEELMTSENLERIKAECERYYHMIRDEIAYLH